MYGATMYGATMFGATMYGATMYGATMYGATMFGDLHSIDNVVLNPHNVLHCCNKPTFFFSLTLFHMKQRTLFDNHTLLLIKKRTKQCWSLLR